MCPGTLAGTTKRRVWSSGNRADRDPPASGKDPGYVPSMPRIQCLRDLLDGMATKAFGEICYRGLASRISRTISFPRPSSSGSTKTFRAIASGGAFSASASSGEIVSIRQSI